jgi:3-hydroxy-D-aspartate aldolase
MKVLDDLRLHESLIGRTGSRAALNTPALVIDRDALDRNIERMAAFAKRAGVALRPHAKTHKSIDIARRQIAAGAVGICCAKLGEAEALAQEGVDSILLTSPAVTASAMPRIAALNQRLRELIVVIDNPKNAIDLGVAASAKSLQVLIDIDPGIRRTGVTSMEAAVELLEVVRRQPSLSYRGVQMYCGTQQHIANYAERAAAIGDRTGYLRSVIAALTERDGRPAIVSGCGTGTHYIDAALGVFNEWQVGSYIFMDRQYAECDVANRGDVPYEFSLFVDATVISANSPGMATIDAGFKALSTDDGVPVVLEGAPPGATFRFRGDEHGAIVDPDGRYCWSIGDRVRLAVPHCDPTVNLYDAFHVVSGDTLIDVWPVTARGRSR